MIHRHTQKYYSVMRKKESFHLQKHGKDFKAKTNTAWNHVYVESGRKEGRKEGRKITKEKESQPRSNSKK